MSALGIKEYLCRTTRIDKREHELSEPRKNDPHFYTAETNDDGFKIGRFHELQKCNSRGGKFNGSSKPALPSMVLLISRQLKKGQAIHWLEDFIQKACNAQQTRIPRI